MSAPTRIAARRSLTVGGETLVLRPSFGALVAAEEELGSLFELVERAAEGALRLSEIAALVRPSVARPADGDHPRADWRGGGRAGAGEGDAGAAHRAGADPAGAVRRHVRRGCGATVRCCGVSCWAGGPTEFWNATPAELALALSAAGEADRGRRPRADRRAATRNFPIE